MERRKLCFLGEERYAEKHGFQLDYAAFCGAPCV